MRKIHTIICTVCSVVMVTIIYISKDKHRPLNMISKRSSEKVFCRPPEPEVNGDFPFHNFSYHIENPHICRGNGSLYCLIYLYSTPNQFEDRKRIRKTWGRLDILKYMPRKIVFFLGRTRNGNVMKMVMEENDQFGDIVLAEFLDSRNNLTHKGVMALEWMNKHCNSARYYVKVDMDVLLNIFVLKNSIDTYLQKAKRSFLCRIWWNMASFPVYCSGPTWIFTADLLRPLYLASFRVRFQLVEDAYTSGLLSKELGNVRHIGPPGLMETLPQGAKLTRFTKAKKHIPLVTVPEKKIYNEAWSAMLDRLSENQNNKVLMREYIELIRRIS